MGQITCAIKKGFPPLEDLTPIYIEYDDGSDWEGFVKLNEAMGQEIDPETGRPYGGLLREELEALAEFCWANCKDWGPKELADYYFLIDNDGNKKKVDIGSRAHSAFMALVALFETQKEKNS